MTSPLEMLETKRKLILYPKESNLYRKLAEIMHKYNSYDEAIRAYELSLDLNDNNDETHCKLGLTFHNLGQHLNAIMHYEKALYINPLNPNANYYLGFILIQENKIAEAIKYLKKCLQITNDIPEAFHLLSLSLERMKKSAEAREVLYNRLHQLESSKSKERCHELFFTMGEIASSRRNYESISCHLNGILDILLSKLNSKVLHCFGDSHRSVFNNISKIRCYNVGQGTAYNLLEEKSSSGAGSKIINILKTLSPNKDSIILTFAEIDCMEHIGKQSMKSKVNPNEIINRLCNRYFEFVKKLTTKGFQVLIYGPAFSGYALNSYGSPKERNYFLVRFNKVMAMGCKTLENVYFVSLDDLFIDSKSLLPKLEFSSDARHLDFFPNGSSHIQSIILSRYIHEISLNNDEHFDQLMISKSNINHSEGKFYTLLESSKIEELQIGNFNILTPIFISNKENIASSMIIDLLDHLPVNQISFNIHSDKEINLSLLIELFSKDGKEFELKYEKSNKLDIFFNFNAIACRSIRIEFFTNKNSYFTINNFEVKGEAFVLNE